LLQKNSRTSNSSEAKLGYTRKISSSSSSSSGFFFGSYFFPDFKILFEPGLFESVFFSRFFKLRSIFLLAFVQWIRNAGALLSRADVVLEKIEFFYL
jgi:hypothetical protein